jgi:hypothetical protein
MLEESHNITQSRQQPAEAQQRTRLFPSLHSVCVPHPPLSVGSSGALRRQPSSRHPFQLLSPAHRSGLRIIVMQRQREGQGTELSRRGKDDAMTGPTQHQADEQTTQTGHSRRRDTEAEEEEEATQTADCSRTSVHSRHAAQTVSVSASRAVDGLDG